MEVVPQNAIPAAGPLASPIDTLIDRALTHIHKSERAQESSWMDNPLFEVSVCTQHGYKISSRIHD